MKNLLKKIALFTVAFFSTVSILVPAQASALMEKPEPQRTHTIYRYWNTRLGYHYYSTNFNELNDNSRDFKYEGALGKIIREDHKDYYEEKLSPLYRYKLEGKPNYRYSTHKIKDDKFEYIGLVGYISSHKSQTFSVTMYEYLNTNDYFYTNNKKELGDGGYGWKFIKEIGYMAPADSFTPNPTPAPTPTPDETLEKCKTCIYRYWNNEIGRHRYTFSYSLLGDGKKSYVFEGVLGQFDTSKMYKQNVAKNNNFAPQMTKLYFYTNKKQKSYRFSTTKINEKGWTVDYATRYISTFQTDTYKIPMYEFVNGSKYFYTDNPNEVGEGSGWGDKKLIGFLRAFPSK